MWSSSRATQQLPLQIQRDRVSTLYAGRLGRFQMIHCSGDEAAPPIPGSTHGYHLLVPLAGAFVWHRDVGAPVFANSKTILHVGSNDSYTVSHPAGEELSAAFWPRRALLDELFGEIGDRMPVSAPCHASIQLELRAMLAALRSGSEEIEFEEKAIEWLVKVHAPVARGSAVSPKSMQAVRRAKEYIHAHFDDRLSLTQIAEAVGVSPVYLTQLFKAAEGVPLYRYHLDLRLNAALDRLPRCTDITRLALDLGFSSHSHFSTEFARRFGMTPADQRSLMQRTFDARPIGLMGFETAPLCAARGGDTEILVGNRVGRRPENSPILRF